MDPDPDSTAAPGARTGRRRRTTGRRPLALLVVAALLGGCSGPPADVVVGEEGIADLPACEPLPVGTQHPVLAELDLPPGMVVTDVTAVEPLLQVTGLIDRTPLQVRDHYAEDAQLVHIEDEGFEAEVLLDRGRHRVYLRAILRCRHGSVLSLVRAPGDAAGVLPVPGQLPGDRS